jgi:predicted flap endonuclease-1-like 5' DNA nuclease
MMSELFTTYWPVILIALLIGLVAGFLLLRPRQRVRLTESAPVRPHMATRRSGEGHGVADAGAAATSDVVGQFLDAQIHQKLPGGAGPPDELEKLKGVGPKLAAMLRERGLTRFEQLARLSDSELGRIDDQLGPFRGRLARDRVAEQAAYLARGDTDGFEQRFGKL